MTFSLIEPITTSLQRGDWIGVVIAVVIGLGTALVALWKQYSNEKKRADTALEIIRVNTEVMKSLIAEIKAAVELSTSTNERLLQALVDNLKSTRE